MGFFFINERLKMAFETTEGGLAKWDIETGDFSILLTSEERSKN